MTVDRIASLRIMTEAPDDTPLGRYQHSRNVIATSLSQWLDEHDRITFDFGYDAGFHAGWDAAVRRLTQRPDPEPPTDGSQLEAARTLVPNEAEQSAKDVVLSIVREKPGLRGVEIVEATNKSANPLHERTVRTALHRLKVADLIRNVDGKWFLANDGRE